MDSDHAYYSNHSAAVARSKALDLCSAWAVDGGKVLPLVPNENEVDLSSEHVKSVGLDQSCDMPWEDVRVLSFVPDRDGYASYGRPLAYWVHEAVFTIEEATTMSYGKVRMYEHHGNVPTWALLKNDPVRHVIPYVCGSSLARPITAVPSQSEDISSGSKKHILSEPARTVLDRKVVELPWHVASPAEGTIKIWLVDTGCGHDLIGKSEVASSGGVCRPAK